MRQFTKIIFILCFHLSALSFIKKIYRDEINFYENKYNQITVFLHEFHHILETNILAKETKYNDVLKTYIMTGNINNQKDFCTANVKNMSFHSLCYDRSIFKNSNDEWIKKIKFALAGYAAEEALKRKSFLFKYFNKKNMYNFFTKSFILMAYRNFFSGFPVADIEVAIQYAKNIDYRDYQIRYYIDAYKKKNEKDDYVMREVKTKLLDCHMDVLYFLGYLYDNLIEKYASDSHQEKIFHLLQHNKDLGAYEIFFLPDLYSLWNNGQMRRDLSNIKSFSEEERKIILNLQVKALLPFDQIKKISQNYKEKNDYLIKVEIITKKLKNNIHLFFEKNFKKGNSFFGFFKKYILKKKL